MVKGNRELRFRADNNLHDIVSKTQEEIGSLEKSAAAKLLITLGNDKINEVVNFLDNITHPLSERQFEEMFLTIKIRVKQLRKQRLDANMLSKSV